MIKILQNINKKRIHFLLVLTLVIFIGCQSKNIVNCEIKTTQGSIFIELYPDKAPITVNNFLKYVDKGLYTNSSFFRVTTPQNEADRDIKIEVIQGGFDDETLDLTPINIETTKLTGLKHLNGTLSMARDQPNSATNSFFICISKQPSLDYGGKRNPDGQGFAAFGKVIKGMSVVRKIQSLKNDKQTLINPVTIISINRIEYHKQN
jgi:peptidyl-prolyl cis-trans isomerase A (cyclophilin A)